jgi:hypothetical protein
MGLRVWLSELVIAVITYFFLMEIDEGPVPAPRQPFHF